MTNLLQTLFRIDPTEGFIQYVETVKPYRSKILDVLVEYVYTDQVNARVTEKWQMEYVFSRPGVDTVYSCGYGYRWDPTSLSVPEAVPTARVLSSTAQTNAQNANSFLIESPTFNSYNIVVADKKSNQLMFAIPYTIVGVNVAAQSFTVTGDITLEDHFSLNNHIYVANNAGTGVDGRYTVAAVVVSGANSIITVVEPISLLATVSGSVNAPVVFDHLPYWPSGTAVKVTTTGVLPSTLSSQSEYHFVPLGKPGLFNLATTRYPDKFDDFVDLTTLGSGVMTILRTEPFVPGDSVVITGSKNARNDRKYLIGTITKEADNFRIQVLQRVNRSSTSDQAFDGVMTLVTDTFSLPEYCALAKSSDVHAETFIHEDLRFSFEITLSDNVSSVLLEDPTSVAGQVANIPTTTVTTALTVAPHGFDGQIFDVGGMQ